MSETNELNFDDLSPITIPCRIAGQSYVLHEASGDASIKWRNAQLRASKIVDGKVSGLEGMPDSEPLLVSLCLFSVTDKGEKPVPLATIRAWPNRVQKALYNKVHEISDLNEADTKESLVKDIAKLQEKLAKLEAGEIKEDPSKNLLSSTKDGSD